MRIVCLSDTHGNHSKIDIPSGDVLIFAGDACGYGHLLELEAFYAWFKNLPHKHKIFVAGNHDRCLQNQDSFYCREELMTDIVYLQDEVSVIDGIKFYGSPWQPFFCSWAFNLPRGTELQRVWSLIPNDTDVLITHCPPMGILDRTEEVEKIGCEDLRERISNLHQLKVHIFGHIHYSYGVSQSESQNGNNVQYVNASICTEEYEPLNNPIVIEL